MAEETVSAPAAKKTDADIRREAILAYYDAKTKEDKAAVVNANPFLAELFSEVNHS